MSQEEGGPRLVACTVERRGRFLVAQPLFNDGEQLALGRRSGLAVQPGELVVVERAGGSARVVERLGSPDHVGHVLRALLLERGLAGESPEAALREARRAAAKSEQEGHREDLTSLEAVTIDPPAARDFDDAISLEPDGDGLRAWVHIADVASYVQPGGALDDAAGGRTCSVYVPGTVEPMLPLELSADACSLRPGEVRRVVTLEVRIGADGKPGTPRVHRALIRSRARLTYDDAQDILSGKVSHPQGDLLARADALARDLRARRQARGAFTLASRELSFEIDDGRVVNARWDEEPRAHALIEELMLLANEAVGGLLARARRPAIYRVHDHPTHEALLALVDRLTALGLPVVPLPERLDGPAASRAVSRQADLLEPIFRERPATREAFGTLLLRTLQVARYDTVNTGHAALASAAYVHFTSPIRRYPDIVVHRAACALASLGEQAPKARGLPEVALRCSLREREATDAERRAEAICLAFLLRDRLRRDGWHQAFDGVVIGLIGAGLFLRFGDVFEGFLPARRLDPRERFDMDEHGVALVGRTSGRRIRLGDELSCIVTAVDPPRGRATLDLVPEDDAPRSRTRPAKSTTPRRPPKPARSKPAKRKPAKRKRPRGPAQ
ncbi:MAG TPA: RNB domain-containing ribonuclease [Gaiellales bacterium]|nr:RNB domain-containing ribonuclease [Gaiellales bacterium]